MIIGQFGCGRWGQNIRRNLLSLGCDVKIYDPNLEEDDLESVMKADAFVVSVPSIYHAKVVETLPDKPIFVEKPMALTLESAESIRHVSMVGHLMLHHPAFTRLREMTDTIFSLSSVRIGGRREPESDALLALGVHDVAMATALDPSVLLDLTARYVEDWRYGRVRRFTARDQTHTYVIDHDELWMDSEPVFIKRDEPLRLEMEVFINHIRTGEPVESDGEFGLRVIRRLWRARTIV